MAVELKDAAGRYELLEKESQAKAADLKKAMEAAKEARSKNQSGEGGAPSSRRYHGWEALFVAVKVWRSEICPSGSIMECCRCVFGLGNKCC